MIRAILRFNAFRIAPRSPRLADAIATVVYGEWWCRLGVHVDVDSIGCLRCLNYLSRYKGAR